MTEEQREVIYLAYLGLHILRTMCRTARLTLAAAKCSGLIEDFEKHFPFTVERAVLAKIKS